MKLADATAEVYDIVYSHILTWEEEFAPMTLEAIQQEVKKELNDFIYALEDTSDKDWRPVINNVIDAACAEWRSNH